jgi:hypothetical protein
MTDDIGRATTPANLKNAEDKIKGDADQRTMARDLHQLNLEKATVSEELTTATHPSQEVNTSEIDDLPTKEPAVTNPHPLRRYSLLGSSAELAKKYSDPYFVLFFLALSGQWTLFYAAPNSGKTLLTLFMLCLACMKDPASAKNVYYINADDNFAGMLDKLRIAEKHGFNMLVPGYYDFKAADLIGLLDDLCKSGNAPNTVIILDTLKKFADLMDKSQQRRFNETVRIFTMRGGTIVALAHTNKRKGADGKPIPEGTADMLNDSDSAYLLYEVSSNGNTKTVTFESIKSRGHSPQSLSFEYSTKQGLDYSALLESVQVIDEEALTRRKLLEEQNEDAVIVEEITRCIRTGVTSKMQIKINAAQASGLSERHVLKMIDKYSGSDPQRHKWVFKVGERGRKDFQLLSIFGDDVDEF